MPDRNKTEVVVILDESGSMSSRRGETLNGLASLIKTQSTVAGECNLTVTKFSTNVKTPVASRPIATVSIEDVHYSPSGSTALYDAICTTIDRLGQKLAAMPEEQRPGTVLVVIITDGEENASTDHKKEDVQRRIDHQKSQYSWVFNFMGCGIDAVKAAVSINIDASFAVSFGSDNVQSAFANYNQKATSARCLRAAGASMADTVSSLAYNQTDRDNLA